MKYAISLLLGAIMVALAAPATPAQAPSFWVTAYYPTWEHGHLPVSEIDFAPITHIVYFNITPKEDGSLVPATDFSDADSADIVRLAHKAGKKALICVGGSRTSPMFRPAIKEPVRAILIKNIVTWTTQHGYDGVDIDMEPMTQEDSADYVPFIHALRRALTEANPAALLTCATAWNPQAFAKLAGDFDQINYMTYDMGGHYEESTSWHHNALYNPTGATIYGTTTKLASTDACVKEWTAAGVPPSRLGIGIACYGFTWPAVTGPDQVTTTGLHPTPELLSHGTHICTAISYSDIMDMYFTKHRYRWDDSAKAPYLTFDYGNIGFISFDDPRQIALKIAYARAHHLGGVIVWNLGQGYRATQPEGKRHPLLTAIADALAKK